MHFQATTDMCILNYFCENIIYSEFSLCYVLFLAILFWLTMAMSGLDFICNTYNINCIIFFEKKLLANGTKSNETKKTNTFNHTAADKNSVFCICLRKVARKIQRAS